MALPTFQAKGTLEASAISSITPDWPSHQAGDIGILIVESTGGQTPSLSTPQGFQLVTQSNTGATTSGTRLQVYWCRATSGSMSSPTVSMPGNHVMGLIFTIRGARAEGNPIAAYATNTKGSASTSITFPAVTTPYNDCLVFYCAARDNDNASAAFSSASGGNTASQSERVDEGNTAGNGGGFGVYSGTLASLGSSGTLGATVTSSINAMVTIAIMPATFVATGWDDPHTITVQHSQVADDHTDFPTYVRLSDMLSDFWSNVQADGGDIRITDSNGKVCALQVVAIDGGSDVGELHFKAPSLANSTNTEFNVYFGHATAEQPLVDCGGGKYEVWPDKYAMVLHQQESVNNTSNGYTDSTKNLNHGTGTSMSITAPSGKLEGQGAEYDGSADHLEVVNASSLNMTSQFAVSCWVWGDVFSGKNGRIIQKGVNDDQYRFLDEDDNIKFHLAGVTNGSLTASSALPATGGWHHWVGTYDGSTIAIYLDGSSIASQSASGSIGTTVNHLYVATKNWDSGGGDRFDGRFDELRILNTGYTSAWITTEYNNQNSPGTFYTVSTPVEIAEVSPVGVDVAIPSVTAAGRFTAALAALAVSVTVVAVTATHDEVRAAIADPVPVSVSVPSVTANNVGMAAVAPISVQVTPAGVTASYEAELIASVGPVAVTASVPSVSARNVATAGIDPAGVSVVPQPVSASHTETALAAPIELSAFVPVVSAVNRTSAEAEPAGIRATVAETTATHQSTAAADPLGIVVSLQAVIAVSEFILEAEASPVGVLVSIPDVTAVNRATASAQAVGVQIAAPSLTASYAAELVAEAPTPGISVSVPAVTAVNRATASVAPLGLGVSPAAVAADYDAVLSAPAVPVAVSVVVPEITAQNVVFAGVSSVPVSVDVPAVTSEYQASLQSETAPVAVDVTVPGVAAVNRATADAVPAPVQIEIPSVSATHRATAATDPVVAEVAIGEVTGEHDQSEPAVVAPAGITLAVPAVVVFHHDVAAADPLSLLVTAPPVLATHQSAASVSAVSVTVAFSAVSATYFSVREAEAGPVQVEISIPAVAAEHFQEAAADPAGVIVAVPPVTAVWSIAASSAPVGLRVSIPAVQSTFAAAADVSPAGIRVTAIDITPAYLDSTGGISFKVALYRELRNLLPQMDISLDQRNISSLQDRGPQLVMRRIMSGESNLVRYTRERWELELIWRVGSPDFGEPEEEAVGETVIDHFAGKVFTMGLFNADGVPVSQGGYRVRCRFINTVRLQGERENVMILILIFHYVRPLSS